MSDKPHKLFTSGSSGNAFSVRKAATEYEKAQEAHRKNYERLKAERLAREAEKSKDK